jgi:hypothetical protein
LKQHQENQLLFKLALLAILGNTKNVEGEIVKLGLLALLTDETTSEGKLMNRANFTKLIEFFVSIFSFDADEKQQAFENRYSDNVLGLELLHL